MVETLGTIIVALIGAGSGVYALRRSRPLEEAKQKGAETDQRLRETEVLVEGWKSYAEHKDAEVQSLKAEIEVLRARLNHEE